MPAAPRPARTPIGCGFVAFARLGITWRPLADLAFTVQADVASPAYRSSLAPPGGPSAMFGMGTRLRLAPRATLEIAVTEDDGWRRAAPDIGLHAAIRWRPWNAARRDIRVHGSGGRLFPWPNRAVVAVPARMPAMPLVRS